MLCGCDPGGTQTLDLQNRNLTLYSTKLLSQDLHRCSEGSPRLEGLLASCWRKCTKILADTEETAPCQGYALETYGRSSRRPTVGHIDDLQ